MSLSPQEKKALDRVDLDGMLSFLQELVAIPSVGGAESPAQLRVAEWLRETGFETDVWEIDLPTLESHPAYSAEVSREEALGVAGFWGDEAGSQGRTLILNGHVDVVPPGDLSKWSFPPWEGGVVDGHVRGRGSLDMKGGLACGLYAAKAIRDSGVRLKGRLILESVVGEEDGGVGTLGSILRGYRGDGAIIMEPTNLAICPAQAGALSFRITVRGRAAHGCVRDEGVSALEKLFPVYEALVALEAERNRASGGTLFGGYRVPFPISVGVVQGGEWPSTVPDLVRVEGRFGVIPGEDVEKARRSLRTALKEGTASDPWLRDHPPELEWWGGTFLPAVTPVEDLLVRVLSQTVEDSLGMEPRLEGVTFGSDLRHLVLEGKTPTVLFGPGDVRSAHAADERISVRDLERTINALTVMTLRFCRCEND